jgi:hypothetical protein
MGALKLDEEPEVYACSMTVPLFRTLCLLFVVLFLLQNILIWIYVGREFPLESR